jgi:hypothetical protein
MNCIRCSFKIIFLLLLVSGRLLAANGWLLQGQVQDTTGKPLESGSVLALSPTDSSLIKGCFIENGSFKLELDKAEHILLRITALGFTGFYRQIDNTKGQASIDLGLIQLRRSADLKGVEISSRIPLFERDAEKTKINVENSSLSAAGNALEVLRKAPGVKVDNQDIVSIFGKGTAVIYIDGILVTSSDMLKDLPSAEIKDIQILNNPSAVYDAAGKALILITTIKNTSDGLNLSLKQVIFYGKNFITYSGLRVNYKKGKWSLGMGYGLTRGQFWQDDKYARSYKLNDSLRTAMNNSIYSVFTMPANHNYRASATYEADSLNRFIFQYNGTASLLSNTSTNTILQSRNDQPYASYQSAAGGNSSEYQNNSALNYIHKCDTSGSTLSAALIYTSFFTSSMQQILDNKLAASTAKQNFNAEDLQMGNAKMDFDKKISENWRLEAGAKEAYVSKTSRVDFQSLDAAGNWQNVPGFSNGFTYRENILAGYSQVRYQRKKINFRAGLRSEQTNDEGISRLSQQTVINKSYIDYFPSALVSYDLSKDLNAGITFSSRIARPTYQDLDPSLEYVDSLNFVRGNPYLLPEYSRSAEATLTYLKEASFTAGYTHTDGAMKLIVEKVPGRSNAFVASMQNMLKSEAYSLGLTLPYELKWWSTYNTFGYSYNTFTYTSQGIPVNNTSPSFFMSFTNQFTIPKICGVEASFEYYSAAADGMFSIHPNYQFSLSLNKSFFRNKLNIRLMGNDIFGTYAGAANSNVPGYQFSYINKSNTQHVLLMVDWKFGRLKSSEEQHPPSNTEEQERIRQSKH